MVKTPIRGLITPFITTHEPPSTVIINITLISTVLLALRASWLLVLRLFLLLVGPNPKLQELFGGFMDAWNSAQVSKADQRMASATAALLLSISFASTGFLW